MSRIRNLTAALAILAFVVMTSGCARGNVELPFGRPMGQPAGYTAPVEELDGDDVAETSWDRCDGACRFEEARRMCSTTVMVVGAQRQQAHAAFMRFGDRRSFRVAVMKHCAGGGVRYAENRRGYRGGSPKCPDGQTFKPEYALCVSGQMRVIPLNDEREEYYKDCPEIETRLVRRGNRLVKQQRCKPQETRASGT